VLVAKEFSTGHEEIIGKISIREMVKKYCLMIFVFVPILFFGPAEVIDEDIEQDIEKRVYFCAVGLLILV
jgi:hypothetical protein